MELRHRRDADAARARCEGRGERAAEPERDGDEEGRPADTVDDSPALRCLPAVFRHTAGDERAGLCRGVRAVPLHPGTVPRERPDEVGAGCGDRAVSPPVMGAQLHGIHRLLPRLHPDVCEVPYRGEHPRHRRVHHTAAGRPGAETPRRRA